MLSYSKTFEHIGECYEEYFSKFLILQALIKLEQPPEIPGSRAVNIYMNQTHLFKNHSTL